MSLHRLLLLHRLAWLVVLSRLLVLLSVWLGDTGGSSVQSDLCSGVPMLGMERAGEAGTGDAPAGASELPHDTVEGEETDADGG